MTLSSTRARVAAALVCLLLGPLSPLGTVAVAVASPSGAPANPEDPALATGLSQVEEGDFDGAILTLTPLVDRLAPVGGPQAARACLQLGIAHLALDQRAEARRRFRQALDHQPGLRLSRERYSPKVLAAFEEARRERDTAQLAAAKPHGHGRAILLAGAGVAAGVGVALLAGGSSTASAGAVRFAAARFAPAAVVCPNDAVELAVPVGIDVEATNDGDRSATLTSAAATLIIVASPAVPGEVNTAKTAATTASPSTLPQGTTTVHVRTTLSCSNGSGDEPRYNEWLGRVTLVTASGAATLETSDRLRVNIP